MVAGFGVMITADQYPAARWLSIETSGRLDYNREGVLMRFLIIFAHPELRARRGHHRRLGYRARGRKRRLRCYFGAGGVDAAASIPAIVHPRRVSSPRLALLAGVTELNTRRSSR